MDEVGQIRELLVRMGAEVAQAEGMARQLSKRADQISEERGISRIDALAKLLELVRSGRAGESYESPDEKGP